MNRPILLAGLLSTLLVGAAPAFAQGTEADNWKVMSPVQLQAAAEAALPKVGQPAITHITPIEPNSATTSLGGEGLPPADAGLAIDTPPPSGGGAGGATETAEAVEAPVAVEAPAATGQRKLAGPGGAPATKPAVDDGPAYLAEDQPFKLKDYEEPKPTVQAPWWQTILWMLLKLVCVLALLAASLFGVKKLSGGQLPASLAGALGAKGKHLVVLETTSLGPSQAMHLVLVGGDRLLVVGAGPQGLTTLATVDDPNQVRMLLAANSKGPSTPFSQAFDMESVVQEDGSDLYSGNNMRRGWGN